jgi:nudix-type nucleoside diphosphatase (YffH/AdpP family)
MFVVLKPKNMSNVQIIDKETLSDKKFPLKSISFQLFGKSGKAINKVNEIYYRPDAVAVLLYDEQRRKIMLTRQFRLATFLNSNESGYLIEVCAGLIDEGETPEQTAIRETDEETGIHVKPESVVKVGECYSSAGASTELVHLFKAIYTEQDKKSDGGGLEAEGEELELIELDFDEAREKLKNQQFRDMKTILLLQSLFLNS